MREERQKIEKFLAPKGRCIVITMGKLVWFHPAGGYESEVKQPLDKKVKTDLLAGN